jgi:hypothetical protein
MHTSRFHHYLHVYMVSSSECLITKEDKLKSGDHTSQTVPHTENEIEDVTADPGQVGASAAN